MKDKQAKYPQLRFKGFTDPWEQRKLGDYLSLPKKKKVEITNARDLLTLKLHLRGIEAGTGRETLSLGSTVYYKRSAGQFLYGKQNFFNGSMAIIPKKFDGKATSGDVPALDINGINSSYLYTYVSRHDYWKAKEGDASGTGSKRIHESTLLKFGIMVPVNNAEQQKIGSFFKQLDDTITLHQRKLDLLKEQKKGYLQKMFPKNGAKVPELRFAGFADDWEERKLGELSQKISVGIATSSSKHFSSQDQGVPFIKNQDIKENRINTKNLEYISKEFDNKNKNKRVKQGDIITARTGYPGLSAVVPKELEGAQTFTTLITRPISEMILSEYISIFINSPYGMKQISGMEAGGAQKNVNAGILQILLIPLPSLDEQKKISNFILKLDDTIALHQRKLDLLKEQKKGFLQKMFV